MANMLIDDYPILFLPKLAEMLGSSDRALLLQQIHYWLQKSQHEHDGHKWIYNTIKNWHKQFNWISERTLRSILKYLEDEGILLTGNYNKLKFDRTKWYTIDYDRLEELTNAFGNSCRMGKENSAESNRKKLPKETGKICQTNTRDYSETSLPEINSDKNPLTPLKGGGQIDPKTEQAKEVIDYLNQQAGTNYRKSGQASQRIIKARLKEGFTVDDCKKVIDNKVKQWGNDDRMNKYLRPSTLFQASKFEGYLNQKPVKTWEEKEAEKYEVNDFWEGADDYGSKYDRQDFFGRDT